MKNKVLIFLLVSFFVIVIGGGIYFWKEANTPVIDSSRITIEASPGESKRTPTTTTTSVIKKDGKKVAEIKTYNGQPATLYKLTKKYAYFRTHPSGVGGVYFI